MSILYDGDIAIAPLTEGDLPEIYKLNMNYDTCVGAGFWVDMPTYQAFDKWMHEYMNKVDHTKCHMAIVARSHVYARNRSEQFMGVVSAFDMSDYHRTAEVAIRIAPHMQRKGIAKKALSLMLKYLFEIRGYRKVYAQIYDSNEASKKLFTSMGFEKEATLKKHEMHMGRYQDVEVYSIWNMVGDRGQDEYEDFVNTAYWVEEDTWGQ